MSAIGSQMIQRGNEMGYLCEEYMQSFFIPLLQLFYKSKVILKQSFVLKKKHT